MTKRRVVSRSSYVDPSKAGKRKPAGTTHVYCGTVEAQWTCNSCGRAGIAGSVKKCPSCGNPKDSSETYAAPSTRGQYLTPEQLKTIGIDSEQHLSDEECEYCGAKLKPGTQKCPNCGAALSEVGYTTRECPACGRQSNEEKCPNCGTPTEEKLASHREEPPSPPPPPPAPSPPASFDFSKLIVPGIIGLVLLCILGCIFTFILWPRNEVATVTAVAWERTIRIEEHQYNRHEGWSLPSDADVHSRDERIRSYDKIQVGTEEECGYEESCTSHSVYDHTDTVCYDDGSCDEEDVYRTERECEDEYVCNDVPVYEDMPVYDTWYIYDVWEWVSIQPATVQGDDNAPYWPEVKLTDEQREEKREEQCNVTFTNDKGKNYPFNAPCDELGAYTHGSEWDIKRNTKRVLEVKPRP